MGCGSSSNAAPPASGEKAAAADKNEETLELKEPAGAGAPAKEVKKEEVLKDVKADERIGEMLKEVPLLMKLSQADRDKLGGAMTEEVLADGELVFKQGDNADKFYIISSGTVSVVVTDEETGNEQTVAQLSDRDYFGEGALLSDGGNDKRGATIKAKGDLKLLSLSSEVFKGLFGNDVFNVKFVHRRVALTAGVVEEASTEGRNTEKPQEIRDQIYKAIAESLLFVSLSEEHVNEMIDQMYKDEVKAGAVVCTQGEHEQNLFVIQTGSFGVYVRKLDEEPSADLPHGPQVAVKNQSEVFGELSLMFASPRAATVVALEDSVVWKLDRFTFQRIKNHRGKQKLEIHTEFLSKVDLLAPLTSFERYKIAEAVEDVTFPAGTAIFDEGQDGDAMYIVEEGQVECTKEGTVVSTLNVGDYFGERALVSGEPRAATVTAKTITKCLKLDAVAFKLLMGPLTEIMEKRAAGYTEEPQNEEPEETLKPLIEGVALEDLKVLGTLGQGSFGHVQLVQLEHEGKTSTYALKGVAKRKIVETHQTMQILNEKKVMMDLRHPMIIQLYTTFKDADQLYFLLEPVLGGELFNLLQKKKRFTETAGRFYAGSVVLAFEYLHNKDYIFRDLKPENVLVDKEGYIKVADFGFAKRLRNNTQTWTMCGTPEYLCPEIIKSAGHGKGADWWTIGVLIFELLAGHTPFYHPSHLTMYNKIAHCRFKHPSHFSNGAQDLISGLLCLKPTQRLGVVKGGAEKVKNHDWFSSLDFEKLESKQYKAPFVPDVRDDADMSNFTKMDNDYRPPKYRETGNNWFEDF